MVSPLISLICAGALAAPSLAAPLTGTCDPQSKPTVASARSEPPIAVVVRPDGSRCTTPCVAVVRCEPTAQSGATTSVTTGVATGVTTASGGPRAVSIRVSGAGASAAVAGASGGGCASSGASAGASSACASAACGASSPSSCGSAGGAPSVVTSTSPKSDLNQLAASLRGLKVAGAPQRPAIVEVEGQLAPSAAPLLLRALGYAGGDADDDDDEFVVEVEGQDLSDMDEALDEVGFDVEDPEDLEIRWGQSLAGSDAWRAAVEVAREHARQARVEAQAAQREARAHYEEALRAHGDAQKRATEAGRSAEARAGREVERALRAREVQGADRARASEERAIVRQGRAARAPSDGLAARVEALEMLARERGFRPAGGADDRALEERVAELERFMRGGDAPFWKAPARGADSDSALAPRVRVAEPRTLTLRRGALGGAAGGLLGGGIGGTRLAPAAPEPATPPVPPSNATPEPPVPAPAPDVAPGIRAPRARTWTFAPSATAPAARGEQVEIERALQSLRGEADRLRAEMERMRAEIERLPRDGAR